MVDEGGAKREKIELENTYEWMNYSTYGARERNPMFVLRG